MGPKNEFGKNGHRNEAFKIGEKVLTQNENKKMQNGLQT